MPRGGKRPGAGRPRAPRPDSERLITKSIVLEPVHCRMLAELAEIGACSESAVVRSAITSVYLLRRREDESAANRR